ncbi:MAG: type II toxin-antitoxin system VapB family antitoxin [Akkermansiaceae bacterium]|nr:type II toxin-antitoxin system VapB family antitoxin [Akkermansiaceae bacterium]
MRTTVTLDDDLLASASNFSGIDEKSKLLNFVLDAYVKRMAAKRLAALGGSMPDFDIAPRDSRVSYHSDSTSSNTKVAGEK